MGKRWLVDFITFHKYRLPMKYGILQSTNVDEKNNIKFEIY